MYKVTTILYDEGAEVPNSIAPFAHREKAFDFYSNLCDDWQVPCNVGLVNVESGGPEYGVKITLTETIDGEGEE